MCGIVGIIELSDKSPDAAILQGMNRSIQHRGPDDNGYFIDKNVGLAHSRLSILDLSSNGHQPMISQDEDYVITFNGEIYNHLDIRKQLKGNYNYKSHSDTETILYGFIELGEKLFPLLNGFFAFAIYQKSTRKLILVRDQFGQKPLYWQKNASAILFGSEIKSLIEHPGFDRAVNPQTFSSYLNFLWSPGKATPFESVEKLLPGHLMRINTLNNTFEIEKYYEIPFDGQYSTKTEEELIEELDQKLTAAVQRQLLSDVPVGFYLSGGVDSSLIVAIAKKMNPSQQLRCFTINSGSEESFEGFENDLYYARIVAKHLDVSLCEIDVQANIVEHFDKMIWHLDEPQADPAPLNVMLICQQAQKEGYKVLLGGTGGDDLFSGYRRHQVLTWEKYIVMLPQFIRNFISTSAKKLKNSNPHIRRIKKLLLEIKKSPSSRMVGYFSWISWHSNKALFTPQIQAGIEAEGYHPDNYMFRLLENIPEEKNILNQCLYLEMRSFLPDHNLNYTDKLSMSTGVESRIPFLDLELVNFSTKIPPHLKLKGKTAKYILKKVTERYLPKEIVYRSKVGFGAPIRKWITNDLTEKILTDLSEENVTKRGIFDYPSVKRLIVNTQAGKIDGSYIIWSLLAIESWMRQFVDKKPG